MRGGVSDNRPAQIDWLWKFVEICWNHLTNRHDTRERVFVSFRATQRPCTNKAATKAYGGAKVPGAGTGFRKFKSKWQDVARITLLRVIPTLTHYSDIVSDISSGCLYGIYIYYIICILTVYLTIFLAYTLTLFLASIRHLWHSFWHPFWHSSWHLFQAFILAFYISGIYSAILSCIYQHAFWHSIIHMFWHSNWQSFWHSIWHIFWHSIRHSVWHSLWHVFGSRRGPLHPELTVWSSGPDVDHTVSRAGEGNEEDERSTR